MTHEITFRRLSDVLPRTITSHMTDPRVITHMPLAGTAWDDAASASFIAAKEANWQRDRLGHQAIYCDGEYVGWGGFQKEGDDWDFGLVLKPGCFGLGPRITRLALAQAREDGRISSVTFLLPPSRRHLRGLDRLGAVFVAEVVHEGSRFLKYRLEL